jgi:transcriptional regulator with XRE-family HTH domain
MRDAKQRRALVTLGVALRTVREQRAMTRADLSDASGLHRDTIARIARGRCNPRFDTLTALWRGLGGSLADVLDLWGDGGDQDD